MHSTASTPASRSGGRLLLDQLLVHGTTHAFCVPGESYLDVLDALHDSPVQLTVCRQEGGAAMMAEAHGKMSGSPGICFVTRGPGATNASPGVHIARQDSTPMILFVGQVRRGTREREGFQEIDYRATFGDMAKWVTEIDDAERIPEIVSRAFQVATAGRPGPVVIALPEDMLTSSARVHDARPYRVSEPVPSDADLTGLDILLENAQQPLAIVGGSRWTAAASETLVQISDALRLPVATSFRRQSLFPDTHDHYAGDIGVACEPALVAFVRESDLLVLIGGRFSEMPSQGWSLMNIPTPEQKLVHVHPGAEELGRLYQADIAINASPTAFVSAWKSRLDRTAPAYFSSGEASASRRRRETLIAKRRAERTLWSTPEPARDDRFDTATAILEIGHQLPPDTMVTNGAGNYATWVHRYHSYTVFGSQLAPTSGSMGYGVPAAVAAARVNPSRRVVAFAGDGCFLMNGQEFATAVQYELPIVVIIIDNGMYGTIRMHQEKQYPARVSGTSLRNPDFAAYASAFGGHGERVETNAAFGPALARALASGKPSILHCLADPDAITIGGSLMAMRQAASPTF